MTRFTLFLFGLVVGGGLIFTALKYHVVRANDGHHFVPKNSATLAGAYVDIREFTIPDWQKNQTLAADLYRANKAHLIQNSAIKSIEHAAGGLLQGLTGDRTSTGSNPLQGTIR